MSEAFGTVAMVLAVPGVLLNNHMNRWCFVVWIISNVICAVLHHAAGMQSLVVRDVIFTVLAGHGFYKWSKK